MDCPVMIGALGQIGRGIGRLGLSSRPQGGVEVRSTGAFTIKGQSLQYRYLNGVWEMVTALDPFMPVGWKVRAPADVPVGKKAYYVSRTGNNADGLSWATAFNSLATAHAQADVDIVFVDGTPSGALPMRYGILQQYGAYTGSRDIAWIAVGGRPVLSAQTEETWSADTNPGTFISTTTGGTPVQVFYLAETDANGGYRQLTKVADKAAVAALPYSWCQNGSGGSSTVTVNLPGGATPTNATTLIQRLSIPTFSGTNCKHYFYGFDLLGGFRARTSDVNSVFATENCKLYANTDSDGWQIKDVGLAISIDDTAFANFNDGFNVHALNGVTPAAIIVRPTAYRNLAAGTGNGVTGHEDCPVFILDPRITDNNGPGISFVDSSKVFVAGGYSNNNGLTGGSSNAWGLLVEGTVEAWIDRVTATGNMTYQFGAQGTATVHHRGCSSTPVNVSGTATIDQVFA